MKLMLEIYGKLCEVPARISSELLERPHSTSRQRLMMQLGGSGQPELKKWKMKKMERLRHFQNLKH
jgi:hypothetical protein